MGSLSKRFFISLAKRFKEQRGHATTTDEYAMWVMMVRAASLSITEEAPSFNREKFYEACGYTQGESFSDAAAAVAAAPAP